MLAVAVPFDAPAFRFNFNTMLLPVVDVIVVNVLMFIPVVYVEPLSNETSQLTLPVHVEALFE